MNTIDFQKTQKSIDAIDVISVLNRFVLSVDRHDWNTMRSCLTDTVEFDYSALNVSMPRSADALVEQVRSDQSSFLSVQHMTTNHAVTVEGNSAQCLANVRAQHLLPSHTFWTLIGRYSYRLVRTSGGWKIQGCAIAVYWTETDGKIQPFGFTNTPN